MTRLILAESINVGISNLFRKVGGPAEVPVVSINFPKGFADALVQQMLLLFGKPELSFVNVDGPGDLPGTNEVAAYLCIRQTALPVSLPDYPWIQDDPNSSNGHTNYVIGERADIDLPSITKFKQAYQRAGNFYLTIGYEETRAQEYVRINDPAWYLKVDRLSDDVQQNIHHFLSEGLH
jgi:hypothetical protein